MHLLVARPKMTFECTVFAQQRNNNVDFIRVLRYYFAKFHDLFYYSITDFGFETCVNVDGVCAVYVRPLLKRSINQDDLDSLQVFHKSKRILAWSRVTASAVVARILVAYQCSRSILFSGYVPR